MRSFSCLPRPQRATVLRREARASSDHVDHLRMAPLLQPPPAARDSFKAMTDVMKGNLITEEAQILNNGALLDPLSMIAERCIMGQAASRYAPRSYPAPWAMRDQWRGDIGIVFVWVDGAELVQREATKELEQELEEVIASGRCRNRRPCCRNGCPGR